MNKGSKHSPETCQKISSSLTGKNHSPETRKKMSDTHKGKKQSTETRKKNSEAKKGEKNPWYGKKPSPESRKKMSDAQTGEKSWRWRGGISFEPYTPEFNNSLKRQIRERDDYTCQICGNNKALHVHHIDYNKNNCNPSNLITLCHSCHAKTNNRRAYWAAFLGACVRPVITLEVLGLVEELKT